MIKCYVFAIGGLPNPLLHPKQARRVSNFLNQLGGLMGLHVYDKYHTLLAFETYNQAVIARNRVRAEGNTVANHIMHAEMSEDKQTLKVLGPAEGENT